MTLRLCPYHKKLELKTISNAGKAYSYLLGENVALSVNGLYVFEIPI